MHAQLEVLLEHNKKWACGVEADRPGFFSRLQHQQTPEYLWIGCADSRVPANELVGLQSGELFVHRNIANVVAHSDLNCLSVIQYAVDVLRVKHIITVGHSGCGGVSVALSGQRIGIADNWVRHVRDVVDLHSEWLGTLAPAQRLDAACRLNVIEQARNVCKSMIVQDAWQRGQELSVQGWIYGLHNGVLEDLGFSVTKQAEVDNMYEEGVAAVRALHFR